MSYEIRGVDKQGSGAYRAPRGGRKHRGIDICCSAGDSIRAVSRGIVTKIGYPYSQSTPSNPDSKFVKKKALRYVEITDRYGVRVRYFYVKSAVKVGENVAKTDIIGTSQGLGDIYSEITEHYHFEVMILMGGTKVFLDPEQYLYAAGV